MKVLKAFRSYKHDMMRTRSLRILFSVLGLLAYRETLAQDQLRALQIKEVHLANSMGWGFPLGETAEVLRPKYSTNLGLDIALSNPRFFLFPSMDFLAFNYNQQLVDAESPYRIERGSSYFYQLNLSAGTRMHRNRLAFHAYVGPGVSLVTEPRAGESLQGVIRLTNQHAWTPTVRLGAGSYYQVGQVRLFLDLSYLHHFRQIQQKPVHVLVVYGGLRTNITRVADRVVEMISEPAP